jgi:two-component system LytT family response regulator
MLLTCIAIDDEPLALKLIKEYVSKIPALQLLETFEDGISAIDYLNKHKVNILFVDINMPDITGIELVRSLDEKPMVIFTTAYKKFAYEGFELDAIDYLLKPIDFTRFNKAAQKAIDYYAYKNAKSATESACVFVRSEYKMLKVMFDDIEYVEGLEDYVKIHIKNQKPILTLATLKTFIEKLPSENFLRIHRSYVIPIDEVVSVYNKKVLLKSRIELPIGITYSDIINKLGK